MKSKRTYFFQMFGKSHWGVVGVDIRCWDEDGGEHIVVLKQRQQFSPTMELLWYTIDGSKWQALEKGKRTENGVERNDFKYI